MSQVVVVVGAGVSGLTTALQLARSGIKVRVVSRDLPAGTTSVNAGAIWGPHLAGHPRVARWAATSLTVLRELAEDTDRTGVRLVSGVEAARERVAAPAWMSALESFETVPEHWLPAGFAVGWRYRVPIIDMPVYLGYLVSELRQLGVAIERFEVSDFAALTDLGPIVVNCTGLGSLELMKDDTLTPVRGDLVKIIHGIIERCAQVDSRLCGAQVLEHRIGNRPSRPAIRLEPEDGIVHNYGHGGGGVTLSWGCAEDVVAAVRARV